jgi:hypothetical protein
MAVKTISIDLEAYTLLARHKRKGESFSDVIKAHFGPQPTAGRFLDRRRSIRMDDRTLGASVHVVCELRTGAERSRRALQEQEALDRLLSGLLIAYPDALPGRLRAAGGRDRPVRQDRFGDGHIDRGGGGRRRCRAGDAEPERLLEDARTAGARY